ncbi:hypothetical protein RI129_000274 [Pyrocoelia pectoralis]|uniref:Uncharacterized protein n=1 Tax=Pyrocoelia pectoralis TaxID=417401 RepID=A0AAN7VJW5_9COLE
MCFFQKPQNYEFEYGISDPHTGDHKSQWEKKEDGVIYGMYSLLDPDGSMRIVEYTADSINGFRAVVKKIPLHDGHQDITQSPQRHGFNTKLPEYNYAPYTQSARQEDHSKQQNEKPAVHNEEESAEYKKDVDEGPINTETEDVETHKNDEVEEDSGYINYDDENEKYKTDEEEEEDKYPHSLPYHSAEDDEEND